MFSWNLALLCFCIQSVLSSEDGAAEKEKVRLINPVPVREDQSSSHSEPQNPSQEHHESALQEVIRSCFDPNFIAMNGPPNNAEFTLSAADGFRDVTLTFLVNGDPLGRMCKLDWDNWLVPCGKIVSTDRRSGQPVEKRAIAVPPLLDFEHGGESLADHVTGISIEIYSNLDNPHWELTSFHPNNLVSETFIKSFIARGLKAHTEIINSPVYLRLIDSSPVRELYWLRSFSGRTYYGAQWDLEYECIMSRMNVHQRQWYYHYTRASFNENALSALRDQTFDPLPNAWSYQSPLFEFSDIFKEILQKWFTTPNADDPRSIWSRLEEMTVKNALVEFLKLWRGQGKYTPQQQVTIARDTFVYFFRRHQHFDLMARQVLSGYDDSCWTMVGVIPVNDRTMEFRWIFKQPEEDTSASGSHAPNLNPGAPVSVPQRGAPPSRPKTRGSSLQSSSQAGPSSSQIAPSGETSNTAVRSYPTRQKSQSTAQTEKVKDEILKPAPPLRPSQSSSGGSSSGSKMPAQSPASAESLPKASSRFGRQITYTQSAEDRGEVYKILRSRMQSRNRDSSSEGDSAAGSPAVEAPASANPSPERRRSSRQRQPVHDQETQNAIIALLDPSKDDPMRLQEHYKDDDDFKKVKTTLRGNMLHPEILSFLTFTFCLYFLCAIFVPSKSNNELSDLLVGEL